MSARAGTPLRERIEALRPWPEGEHVIEALLRLHDITSTDPAGLDRSIDELLCATCGHGQGRHSSFGMCDGAGTECYCVRFPDAPDFAQPRVAGL